MAKMLVICAKRYNAHELWTLLGVLQKRDHTFDVVSTEKLIKDELTLRPNTVERLVYEVSPSEVSNYDGIAIVSGNMQDTEAYWHDEHVRRLLNSWRSEDKVVSAICCSVPTLAPVVKDVKVSYFPLVRSRKRLEKFGAILQNVSLSVDKRTITAENQMVTQVWADEICNMLEGKDPEHNFIDSGYTPKGRPRRMHKDIQACIDDAKNQKLHKDQP